MNDIKFVSLSEFAVNTRFEVAPGGIFMHGVNYPGCLHVRVKNFNRELCVTPPGGNGLTIAGRFRYAEENYTELAGAFALVAGFAEVMTVHLVYTDTVVLRPLRVGLGSRGARNFNVSRMNIARLTGELPRPAERMLYLAVREGELTKHLPLTVHTIAEATKAAGKMAGKLTANGWTCIQWMPSVWLPEQNPAKWWCTKGPRRRVISVEYGTPQLTNADLG